MLNAFLARLLGGKPKEDPNPRHAGHSDDGGHEPHTPAPPPSLDSAEQMPTGFLCRETVLDRDQRIAGYHFMLHEGARHRAHGASRKVHHAYAEVLVRTIVRFGNGRPCTDRRIFLDVPDSFLDHPAIAELPPAGTVLVIETVDDADAPPAEATRQSARRLRSAGFHLAIPDPGVVTELAALLPEVDYIMVRADAQDPERSRVTAGLMARAAPAAALLARDVPSEDDFRFCHGLGAALFQGPFITRRGNWDGRQLGGGTQRLAALINRLRRGAEIHELAELLKQDPGLALRLLRYINSAAVGLQEHISSIERALMLLGREKLYRWLTVLLYSTDQGPPRASAALETALVRARMMELLGDDRPPIERDALFLAGLLSLIDVVLEVPLEGALASLGAAREIEDAVLHGRGPLAGLLQLAIACETMDAGRVSAAAERCGIPATTASMRHLEALTWALEVDA